LEPVQLTRSVTENDENKEALQQGRFTAEVKRNAAELRHEDAVMTALKSDNASLQEKNASLEENLARSESGVACRYGLRYDNVLTPLPRPSLASLTSVLAVATSRRLFIFFHFEFF